MNPLLGLFLLFVETLSWAKLPDFALQVDSNYQLSLSSLFTPSLLGPTELEEMVKKSNRYEDFLAQLQKSAPELFKRPILIHHSGSLQLASFEKPRVLLFGRGTVLSFTENSTTPNRSVEVITFNPSVLQFEPIEIQFKANQKPLLNRNPKVCSACHGRGRDFHPLWQPYDLWPNVYGVRSGELVSSVEKAKFLERNHAEGIYQKTKPQLDDQDFLLDNNDFTLFLNSLNILRIMSILKMELGSDHPLRYALLATLNSCTNPMDSLSRKTPLPLNQFIPETLLNQMNLNLASLRSDTIEKRKQLILTLFKQYQIYFPGNQPDFSLTSRLDFENGLIADSRLILENLGIEWSRFTMSHGENKYSLASPSNLPFDLGNAIQVFNPDLIQELKPTVDHGSGISWAIYDCDKLAKKSMETLSTKQVTLQPLPPPQRRHAGSGLAPLAKCMTCHVLEKRAPEIPFYDSTLLHQWLNQENHLSLALRKVRSGSMPRDSRLTDDEKESIEMALQRIGDLDK